jgi:hypothetical protein
MNRRFMISGTQLKDQTYESLTEKKEKRYRLKTQKTFSKIIPENFPNLDKEITIQI